MNCGTVKQLLLSFMVCTFVSSLITYLALLRLPEDLWSRIEGQSSEQHFSRAWVLFQVPFVDGSAGGRIAKGHSMVEARQTKGCPEHEGTTRDNKTSDGPAGKKAKIGDTCAAAALPTINNPAEVLLKVSLNIETDWKMTEGVGGP
jgi:hypothetical protein